VAVVCLTGFEGTSPLPSVSFSLAAFSAIHDIHNDDTSQQAGQKGRAAIDQFVFFCHRFFFFVGWSSTQKQARKAIKRADERLMMEDGISTSHLVRWFGQTLLQFYSMILGLRE
jgi:hypothetical protein